MQELDGDDADPDEDAVPDRNQEKKKKEEKKEQEEKKEENDDEDPADSQYDEYDWVTDTDDEHPKYRCDRCGRVIGPDSERFHCETCVDYDLVSI